MPHEVMHFAFYSWFTAKICSTVSSWEIIHICMYIYSVQVYVCVYVYLRYVTDGGLHILALRLERDGRSIFNPETWLLLLHFLYLDFRFSIRKIYGRMKISREAGVSRREICMSARSSSNQWMIRHRCFRRYIWNIVAKLYNYGKNNDF